MNSGFAHIFRTCGVLFPRAFPPKRAFCWDCVCPTMDGRFTIIMVVCCVKLGGTKKPSPRRANYPECALDRIFSESHSRRQ